MNRVRLRAERYGDYSDSRLNSHSATPSWSSEDPPPPHHDPNFDAQRADFSGDGRHHHRQHQHQNNSNRRHHHQNFNSEQGDSLTNSDHSLSLPGRKRQFAHSAHDYVDGGSYVKLYVVGIPRTGTEQEIRSLFEEHGNILEVVLLKDKRTGQQGECCFVKYATLEEADRAIGALHNQYTFPSGFVPIKVRYADGERERLEGFGAHEYKLYVGCLNKQASKMEIEEIFSVYGIVENVYIVCDDMKQSRGIIVNLVVQALVPVFKNQLLGHYNVLMIKWLKICCSVLLFHQVQRLWHHLPNLQGLESSHRQLLMLLLLLLLLLRK